MHTHTQKRAHALREAVLASLVVLEAAAHGMKRAQALQLGFGGMTLSDNGRNKATEAVFVY
jgi:hypothetical protein